MKITQHHKHQAIHHTQTHYKTHQHGPKQPKSSTKRSKTLLIVSIAVLLLITIFIVRRPLWNNGTDGQTTDQKQYYFGVGVGISFYNGRAIVSRVIPGTPAEKAGITLNDIIVAVDLVPVNIKNSRNLCREIRGQEGSDVTISIERQKRTFDKKLIRTKIYSRTPTRCQ